MSGDMNTALGNCVLAVLLALQAIHQTDPDALTTRRLNIICDGDDTILVGERSTLAGIQEKAPEVYERFGQILRVDGAAYQVHQVDFCQHKPFRRSDGIWVMCPNPKKVLQTAFMATGHNAFNLDYFGTLWDQRARIHTGVPCFAPLFSRLAEENPNRLNGEHFFGFEHANPNLPQCEITMEQRVMFQEQWGIDVFQQLAIECAEVTFFPDSCFGQPADWGT